MTTFDTVLKLGLALPDAEESTSYGAPALKVRGKLFVRWRAELDSIVIRMAFAKRDELVAANPDTFYITDHYLQYPWMLVRLSTVDPDTLRDLLLMAWRYAGESEKRPVRKRQSG